MERPIHYAALSAGQVLRKLSRNPRWLSRLSANNSSGFRDRLLTALEQTGLTPPDSTSIDNSGKVTLYYTGRDRRRQRVGITITVGLENDEPKS